MASLANRCGTPPRLAALEYAPQVRRFLRRPSRKGSTSAPIRRPLPSDQRSDGAPRTACCRATSSPWRAIRVIGIFRYDVVQPGAIGIDGLQDAVAGRIVGEIDPLIDRAAAGRLRRRRTGSPALPTRGRCEGELSKEPLPSVAHAGNRLSTILNVTNRVRHRIRAGSFFFSLDLRICTGHVMLEA